MQRCDQGRHRLGALTHDPARLPLRRNGTKSPLERGANGIDDIAPGNSIIGNVTYANEDSGINIFPGGDDALVAGGGELAGGLPAYPVARPVAPVAQPADEAPLQLLTPPMRLVLLAAVALVAMTL